MHFQRQRWLYWFWKVWVSSFYFITKCPIGQYNCTWKVNQICYFSVQEGFSGFLWKSEWCCDCNLGSYSLYLEGTSGIGDVAYTLHVVINEETPVSHSQEKHELWHETSDSEPWLLCFIAVWHRASYFSLSVMLSILIFKRRIMIFSRVVRWLSELIHVKSSAQCPTHKCSVKVVFEKHCDLYLHFM